MKQHNYSLTTQPQCRRTLFALSQGLLAMVAAVGVQADGSQENAAADSPYVMQSDATTLEVWSTHKSPSGLTKVTDPARAGDVIDVPAVGRVPAFQVALRKPAAVEPVEVKTPRNAPLFVVADTHGEYEILVELLQKHRIVDSSLRWSFRRGHLVFLGDVFDRGPNQTEILWLIYKLEVEAAKSGGGVHMVLGNHESMVLNGDVRYLNSKYLQTAQTLAVASYSELFGPRTVLGQWLRAKPAVLKLNDLLCLHGGISRDVIERKLGLREINSIVRDALNKVPTPTPVLQEQTQFVMGQLGPMWYRGYFADQKDFPTATAADVDSILHHFGVSRILVGHTIVPTVTSLYGGKVIAVQVYPRRNEENGQAIMEALRIERGRISRARIDGGTEPLN
jgi:hypothetical protein